MSKVITVQDGNLEFNISFADGDFDTNVQDGNINLGTNGSFTGTINLGTRVDVAESTGTLSIFDSTFADSVAFSHDGTDFNIVGTTTADINITGITAISAATVDATFDAVIATSFSGPLTGAASQVTVNDTADATTFPVLVGAATGNQLTLTDGGLTYDASAANLATTTFTGALSGNATTATTLATGRTIGMTGNVVWTSASFDGSGNVTGTSTIQADVVTMDMIVDVATDTFLGRVTAATGTVEVLTNAQAKTALDLSGSNTGDQTITLTGNVTGTGTGSFATTIASDVVTMDMIVDIATDTFLGRVTAATGTVEVLTNAQAKTALDLTGTNSGDEPAASLTVAGIVELATGVETNTGTDATLAVTPDGLDDWTGSAQFITAGVLTATSYGGITETNLVDKAAAETITNLWSISRSGGAAKDMFVWNDSTDATSLVVRYTGTDFTLEDSEGEAGNRYMLFTDSTGEVSMFFGDVEEFRTTDHTSADQISGAEVLDAEGNFQPVGVGVVVNDATTFDTVATHTPFQQANATQTVYFVGAGAGTANFDTYTNVESGQTNIPVGTMWYVQNNAATTILVIRGGTSVTIRGAGAPADADVTVAQGGVATVRKVSDTIYDVWGIGLS